jgi:glycosyltransferase involved in cell wall biosynthesis
MVVHNLATALSKMGHNVYVVTSINKNHYVDGTSISAEHNYEERHNYRIIRFGFRGYGRLGLVSASAISTLVYVVNRFKIDVINFHNVSRPGSWAYYARRFLEKKPFIATPHGDDVQITPEIDDGIRLNPKWDRIVRRNLGFCTRITSISSSIHKDLNAIVDDPGKIIDVPNGVWVKHFQANIDKVEVRKNYGIPPNAIVLVSIGRNHPRKGFEFGLDAVARLRNEGVAVSYILVGRKMSPIIERARSLGITDCLITPGEVAPETVSEFLQISDIYVSTSIVESFGLTTVEAMSASLPCVVTDVAGTRDIVSPEYGLLVESANSGKLADAIKYLIANPTIRETMSQKACIEAEKYDWPKIAEMYTNVYGDALND